MDDVRAYVKLNGVPTTLNDTTNSTVVTIEFISSGAASNLLDGESIGVPDQDMVCYVELSGSFVFDGPDNTAATFPNAVEIFDAQAFERLWQAVVQGQVACETLSGVLVYLRASLNGAILETLRDSKRPEAVSSIWPDGEGRTVRSELWDWLQARLPNQRDQRLAYLLYSCGLEPAEIVRGSPQEWSDVQEVARLRRSILARLMQGPEL